MKSETSFATLPTCQTLTSSSSLSERHSLDVCQIKSSVFAAKSAHGAVYNVMAESSFAYL